MTQPGKNIFDYLEIIKRRKWLIAVPVLIGVASGALISYTMPAYYRSTTLIMVDEQQVSQTYVTPTDTTPIEKRLSTINQQIMSRSQLEKIVDDFKLYETGQVAQPTGLRARLKAALGLTTNQPHTKEDAVEMLRSDIDIKVVDVGAGKKLNNAFNISYSGRDPYQTMQVANTLASLFIDENLKQREDTRKALTSSQTSLTRLNMSLSCRSKRSGDSRNPAWAACLSSLTQISEPLTGSKRNFSPLPVPSRPLM